MMKYFPDTNFLLRYLLNDDQTMADQVEKYLLDAQKGKNTLIVHPQVFCELEYVLRKVYGQSRKKIVEVFEIILSMPMLTIENRGILESAVVIYSQRSVDFFDGYLFSYAEEQNAEVLSFDRDFRKMKTN